MGTWIFAVGVLAGIGVAGFVFRALSDTPWATLAACIAAVLVWAAAFFIAVKVDPVFAGDYTTVTCVECGEAIGNGDKFCAGCGSKVKE